jgi:hypothetical protein
MPKKVDVPDRLSLNFGKFRGNGQGRLAVLGLLAAYALAVSVAVLTIGLGARLVGLW